MFKNKGFSPKSIILVLIVLLLGYYLGAQKNILQTKRMSSQQNTSSATHIINLSNWSENASLKYFSAQVTAAGSYWATDDNMLEPYNSQGGMAPPRLILMKNYQVLVTPDNGYFLDFLKDSKNDCIAIWATNGESSIEDWQSGILQIKGNIQNPEQITVGSRKATLYLLKEESKESYIAYLPIENTDKTSYYFYTCNLNNKSDFVRVIQSIKFRGDISF